MEQDRDIGELGGRRMLAGVLADAHLSQVESLPITVSAHAAAAGFTQVLIYLVDLQGQVLRLLTGEGTDTREQQAQVRIEGTVPGRAFQLGRILAADPAGKGPHWWVPLLDGTERLGLLRITTTREDRHAHQDMNQLAALLALIIVSKRASSDTLVRLTRTRPLNIAAEMQWNLIPPRSYTDGRVVIAASMEPVYLIGGDVFDYATDGPLVHLSILDAMGHDTAAGLSAHLAIGAGRNARRRGAGLLAIGKAMEEALIEQYEGRRYVTGILAHLDTRTGMLSWVNHGHYPPVIIRGRRWSTLLHCPPGHPMGTGLGLDTRVCREHLEPGDRIVFYTDGITEARGAGDTEFGLARFIDFIIRRHADGLPVPETLRRLVRALLDHHGGHLRDDATVLVCEWLGSGSGSPRQAAELTGLPVP